VNASILEGCRSRLNGELVRSILESTAELVGVDGQLEFDGSSGDQASKDVDLGVVLEDVFTRSLEGDIVSVVVRIEGNSVFSQSESVLGPNVVIGRVLSRRLSGLVEGSVDVHAGLNRLV
jgi:hypothetical protein